MGRLHFLSQPASQGMQRSNPHFLASDLNCIFSCAGSPSSTIHHRCDSRQSFCGSAAITVPQPVLTVRSAPESLGSLQLCIFDDRERGPISRPSIVPTGIGLDVVLCVSIRPLALPRSPRATLPPARPTIPETGYAIDNIGSPTWS